MSIQEKLEYYMRIKYPIGITKIPKDEGGGYCACIPMLGREAFMADGDTIHEALANLDKVKEVNFRSMLEKGLPIKEP
jgi:predicted RNase H-like HicB family nuclease